VTTVSGSSDTARAVPEPGKAQLPAPNAASLLRANATDPARADRPAICCGDRRWTHREYYEESCCYANLLADRLPAGRPRHVGVLADNVAEYLFVFGGAALIGATVVGLNHTRHGEPLLGDITHTDCGLIITEARHVERLRPIAERTPPTLVVGESLDAALAEVSDEDPGLEPDVDSTWALIFTSGTSDAPKAVICSQRRLLVTGTRMGIILGLDETDVGYICMPLFHSNAVQVGWAPSLVYGACVGLARKFSASGWLGDVRRYGATYFNYTGKPLAYILATPERPDDADNSLRVAFGNEGSPHIVSEFARRYGVTVLDAYGATEGGVAVNRTAESRPGTLGQVGENVRVVDEAGRDKAVARFDDAGRLLNADECVGEMVNTDGAGPFEGYYKNPEATEAATRNGWYWTGDLGYLDAERNLCFAGRNADWIRVDGENFPAAPIEEALRSHPDVVLAAVYGVPDDQAGDQAMAGLVVADPDRFAIGELASWLDAQPDVGAKWRPRYVRVLLDPPTTGTNKIVKRVLVHQKWRSDRVGDDPVYVRGRGEDTYRPFTPEDEVELCTSFAHYERDRFWDL